MSCRSLTYAEKMAFLEALEKSANTRDAARAIGRAPGTLYNQRKFDEDFREAWDAIAPVQRRGTSRPRDGFVSAAPFREALTKSVLPGKRSEFARLIGVRRTFISDIVSGKQRTLSTEMADFLATKLGRFDLWVADDSLGENATIPAVGAQPCPKSGLTLLEREARAWRALLADPGIHPADALAMVVWPPERFLEDAA